MVPRIRRGVAPHVYLREWRKAKNIRATDMADRLGIERESYYRLERNTGKLSLEEVYELADALGIDHHKLWTVPPPPGLRPRPSLDEIVADVPDSQVEGLADMLRRAAGK